MLEIFICEDNMVQRELLKRIIKDYLSEKDWDMQLVCASASPDELLEHIKHSDPAKMGLYFLDIQLQANMDGIDLAREIRQYDPRGFIVFVTAYSQYMPMIFTFKLELMDYILKGTPGNIINPIESCLESSWNKYKYMLTPKNSITFRTGTVTHSMFTENIYYIEKQKGSAYVSIHEESRTETVRCPLHTLEEQLPPEFIRIHQAYIVNKKHIENYDFPGLRIIMDNRQIVPMSVRCARALKRMQKNSSQ